MSKLITEWDLEKYFYSSITDDRIKNDLNVFLKKSDIFIEKYKNKISDLSDDDFLIFLEEMDGLSVDAEKVMVYMGFASSLDSQNQDIQKESARISKILSDYNEKFLFIDEEYKKMGFKKFEYLWHLEIMSPYKNYLKNTGTNIQYLLGEPEEKVIIKLSSAYGNNLYEELTTSFEFSFNGEKISEDEIRTLRESQDREVRKEAFKALADMYLLKQNQIVFGNLYSLVCKDNIADIELRKFNTVMSQRNISEELSDNTVDNLLNAVSDNYGLYHMFLEKKAAILRLKQLENYDIYAPYPIETEAEALSFEEGWELYKKTIENVDPLLHSFSEEMLSGGRISVYPKQGKASGAYAQYTKSIPEFVLLNWSNTYSDVTTLAHELGHAFHGNLSKIQKNLVYNTPLTLAETASIFNETLMFETLLETTTDKNAKKKLICSRLEDIFGTIFRQVAYVMFEKRCHESFQTNQPLTYGDYNKIWYEEMTRLMGPIVNLDENLIKFGWSSISHVFHTPFYCYTYAFGNLISLNLYQNYKNSSDKKEFIKKYHEFLSAGGSDTPENLLSKIFNMKFDEEFYRLAFVNIGELIKKLDE